ncbi:MAG: 50S ribosomal protein L21 [bacterium]|nr:50S ribosomal protein L21 [bacterium]
MYAIVADGARQYRVEEGQEVTLDLQDVSKGDEYTFEKVLAVSGDGGFQLGAPVVDGVTVTAEVVGVEQGKKIYIQKFRRRKNSRRRTGHRQMYTRVRITSIGDGSKKAAPKTESAPAPAEAASSEEE